MEKREGLDNEFQTEKEERLYTKKEIVKDILGSLLNSLEEDEYLPISKQDLEDFLREAKEETARKREERRRKEIQ